MFRSAVLLCTNVATFLANTDIFSGSWEAVFRSLKTQLFKT
jgi:hypothetical protein